MNVDEIVFSDAEYDALMLAAVSAGGITGDDADVIQADAERACAAYLSYRLVLAGELSVYVHKGEVRFISLDAARKRARLAEDRGKRANGPGSRRRRFAPQRARRRT